MLKRKTWRRKVQGMKIFRRRKKNPSRFSSTCQPWRKEEPTRYILDRLKVKWKWKKSSSFLNWTNCIFVPGFKQRRWRKIYVQERPIQEQKIERAMFKTKHAFFHETKRAFFYEWQLFLLLAILFNKFSIFLQWKVQYDFVSSFYSCSFYTITK